MESWMHTDLIGWIKSHEQKNLSLFFLHPCLKWFLRIIEAIWHVWKVLTFRKFLLKIINRNEENAEFKLMYEFMKWRLETLWRGHLDPIKMSSNKYENQTINMCFLFMDKDGDWWLLGPVQKQVPAGHPL